MRVIVIVLLLTVSAANAEVIHIPVGSQAADKQDLPRPVRGMHTDEVLEQFGLPQAKTDPVGDPPISSWRYPAYTVYFESDTVIHSVLQHVPKVDVDAPGAPPG